MKTFFGIFGIVLLLLTFLVLSIMESREHPDTSIHISLPVNRGK